MVGLIMTKNKLLNRMYKLVGDDLTYEQILEEYDEMNCGISEIAGLDYPDYDELQLMIRYVVAGKLRSMNKGTGF